MRYLIMQNALQIGGEKGIRRAEEEETRAGNSKKRAMMWKSLVQDGQSGRSADRVGAGVVTTMYWFPCDERVQCCMKIS
jgi:hypothetical protein